MIWAFNCTKRTLLAREIERAESVWARMGGLIGRSADEFQPGKGLWITPSEGVHTIGMRFPIDVVYLDARQRIILTYHRLAPFRIGAVKLKARSVLELPAGVLDESRTERGDLLHFFVAGEERGSTCYPGS